MRTGRYGDVVAPPAEAVRTTAIMHSVNRALEALWVDALAYEGMLRRIKRLDRNLDRDDLRDHPHRAEAEARYYALRAESKGLRERCEGRAEWITNLLWKTAPSERFSVLAGWHVAGGTSRVEFEQLLAATLFPWGTLFNRWDWSLRRAPPF